MHIQTNAITPTKRHPTTSTACPSPSRKKDASHIRDMEAAELLCRRLPVASMGSRARQNKTGGIAARGPRQGEARLGGLPSPGLVSPADGSCAVAIAGPHAAAQRQRGNKLRGRSVERSPLETSSLSARTGEFPQPTSPRGLGIGASNPHQDVSPSSQLLFAAWRIDNAEFVQRVPREKNAMVFDRSRRPLCCPARAWCGFTTPGAMI